MNGKRAKALRRIVRERCEALGIPMETKYREVTKRVTFDGPFWACMRPTIGAARLERIERNAQFRKAVRYGVHREWLLQELYGSPVLQCATTVLDTCYRAAYRATKKIESGLNDPLPLDKSGHTANT